MALSEPLDQHAIVIGGGIAGLLAARVLAPHFARVTVIERDRFPQEPATRKGVPQARHVHILLLAGQQLLERYFPDLSRDLDAAGVPTVDMVADFPILALGGWTTRFRSDFLARTCSRGFLEWLVHRRVAAHSNVTILEERQVTGLVATADSARITGVRIRARGSAATEASAPEQVQHADLVVDASGRTSRAPEWLDTLGYGAPRETVINSFLGYATRWYRRPAGVAIDWQGLLLGSRAPDHTRGGVIFPVEGDRWVVTLAGIARDYPPTDEAGFLAFARSLRSPVLYEAIKLAEPLSPIYGYQRTENRLCHYAELARWPEGLVVLGDAACAFNPVYGQGMTTAAQAAEALDRRLRAQRRAGNLAGLGHRFQKDLARVTATPWLMATGEDFRWPTTEGGRPDLPTRLMHRYMDGVITMSSYDPGVYRAFLQVTHLLAPPTALFRPQVVAAVLRWCLTRPRPEERRSMRPLPAAVRAPRPDRPACPLIEVSSSVTRPSMPHPGQYRPDAAEPHPGSRRAVSRGRGALAPSSCCRRDR